MKVLCGLACLFVLAAGAGLVTQHASAAQRGGCSLGQASTKAKPCTANPAFAKTACAALASGVTSLVGAPVSTGANKGAPTGIDCYFKIGGRPQQFGVSVTRGPQVGASYAKHLAQLQAWPAAAESGKMPGCWGDGKTKTPVNAPTALSGIGDKAFSWDQCSDGFNDSRSEAWALKGTTLYAVFAAHWAQPNPTAGALVPYLEGLLTKFR